MVLNDEERRLWVLNHEGLYRQFQESRKAVRQFVRKNRKMIDKVIRTELDRKPAGS